MARWTASAKWAVGPALDGQRDMPLALRLSEGLGSTGAAMNRVKVQRFQKTETDRLQRGQFRPVLLLPTPRA